MQRYTWVGWDETPVDRIIAAIDYRRQAMIQTERNTLSFILIQLIKAELPQ